MEDERLQAARTFVRKVTSVGGYARLTDEEIDQVAAKVLLALPPQVSGKER